MKIADLVDNYVQHKSEVNVYWCVTLYNCLVGNCCKAPTKSVNYKIDYQSEIFETDKYITA